MFVVPWIVAWLWLTRGALLDDTFIHLRYAMHLRALNGFVYNPGSGIEYGCSSPLWACLLALLGASCAAAKGASIAGWLAALALLCRWLREPRAFGPSSTLALAFLSPSGVRWLTDGMETSLVAMAALTVPWICSRRPAAALPGLLVRAGLACALVLLRIELVTAVTAVVAALVLDRRVREAAAWGVGALAGLAALFAIFGHLVPDTAIAKRLGEPDVLRIWQIARSLGGGMSLGVLALIAVSGAVSIGVARAGGRATLRLALGSLPALAVLLAVAGGQVVQGVRHVLWPVLFLASWSLWIGWRESAVEPPRTRRWAVVALLALIAWPFEARVVRALLLDRSETTARMAGDGLTALAPYAGSAADIGMIGWFTGARILDGSGLVNGRAWAELSSGARRDEIIRRRPDFLYYSDLQLASFAPGFRRQYRVCREYRLSNVTSIDHYVLAVRTDLPAPLGGCSDVRLR